MALWLVRSGSHGEYEKRFLDDKKIYFQWSGLDEDLSKSKSQDDMFAIMQGVYSKEGKDKLWNWTRQAWAFAQRMQVGDWAIMPSKLKPAIHVAKITGTYQFKQNAEDRIKHSRAVEWFATDVPRSNFDQDLLYSFGAFLTVCQISRNDAEARVKAMAANEWKSSIQATTKPSVSSADDVLGAVADIEEVARDGIAKLIIARFKGHGVARLVDTVLRAQGYTTYLSPEGPDKGVDILAAPGELGFGRPRICVQVKSGDAPADSPTLNQLIGTMQNVQAEQGLLVSWSGFKTSVDREEPSQIFRVRLWDRDDLIRQILVHYEKLDEEIRTELPLKRIWTVAQADVDE